MGVRLGPSATKFALTAHITASIGWLGAVIAFLVLAVVAVTDADTATVRALYIVMELLGWYVIVPLSLASLVTGLIQSLGTKWGLLRHYWVLTKLLINLVATTILLLYMQTLTYFATVARSTATTGTASDALPSASPVLHAGGAVVLLLLAAVLSVYKPRGMTRYGQRRQYGLR